MDELILTADSYFNFSENKDQRRASMYKRHCLDIVVLQCLNSPWVRGDPRFGLRDIHLPAMLKSGSPLVAVSSIGNSDRTIHWLVIAFFTGRDCHVVVNLLVVADYCLAGNFFLFLCAVLSCVMFIPYCC